MLVRRHQPNVALIAAPNAISSWHAEICSCSDQGLYDGLVGINVVYNIVQGHQPDSCQLWSPLDKSGGQNSWYKSHGQHQWTKWMNGVQH